ncbi:hypothetical protein [Calycomorphotria hydatis]|uniref:Uncharacterized protein n=1 Tax=Calycomorphotria hydatis TaxID=2528027 RepID=A0A517T4A7_9PLAN|nr:hypothetical protein [Calycomorphotria hydatis]QDT63216.1 hypothetical protein V22_04340 [Calycomorphotria hydatis]
MMQSSRSNRQRILVCSALLGLLLTSSLSVRAGEMAEDYVPSDFGNAKAAFIEAAPMWVIMNLPQLKSSDQPANKQTPFSKPTQKKLSPEGWRARPGSERPEMQSDSIQQVKHELRLAQTRAPLPNDSRDDAPLIPYKPPVGDSRPLPLPDVPPDSEPETTLLAPADQIAAIRCTVTADEIEALMTPHAGLTASMGAPDGGVPCNAAAELFDSFGERYVSPRSWPNVTPCPLHYQFYHSPLWYEDANLERCGIGFGQLQPLVSGGYFFLNTVTLPYRFAAENQKKNVAAKPFCGPGRKYSFAQNYLPPPSVSGSALETVAIVGLVFLIP